MGIFCLGKNIEPSQAAFPYNPVPSTPKFSGCSVPDVLKQKSALQHTCVSQIKNDFA